MKNLPDLIQSKLGEIRTLKLQGILNDDIQYIYIYTENNTIDHGLKFYGAHIFTTFYENMCDEKHDYVNYVKICGRE